MRSGNGNKAAAPAPRDLFERLAPRDQEVISALIHLYWLNEEDIAAQIHIATNNLRARRQNAYRVLGVESRHALIYEFKDIVPSGWIQPGDSRGDATDSAGLPPGKGPS